MFLAFWYKNKYKNMKQNTQKNLAVFLNMGSYRPVRGQ